MFTPLIFYQKADYSFFLAPTPNGHNGLTLDNVEKHEAMESFKQPDPVHSIAGSFKDFSIADEDAFSQSQRSVSQATTFASQFTACSNISFNKLITHFRGNSQLQKDMLAILAALTEVIKEKGGTESTTEYFLGLMETIENAKETADIQAALMLLNMGIKSVPEAVLRKKFNETAGVLLDLIAKFVESSDINLLRTIISCLSVVLRAQEYSQWKLSSSLKFFDAILSFTIHTKPKIRKAAQHAITSILFGSCFMLPPKKEDDELADEMKADVPLIVHPASSRAAKFCVDQFKPEIINNNQTLLLHVLGLLQTVLGGFHKDDIKIISEHLLSIMTSGNMLVRTNCFQTFHALFNSKSNNLTSELLGRLVSALYEYRPDRTDFRQVLAWIMVMKQAHIKLVELNQKVCVQALPRFFEICINDLWMSDKPEVVSGTSNALKEILEECMKPICAADEMPTVEYRQAIKKIIKTLTKALSAPFGATSNHILVLCSVAFESMGKHFGEELEEAITILGTRYDEQSAQRVHIEHAVLSAITSIETETVLSCIPLTEANGNMSVKRSWILPLLREGLQNSSLEFFSRHIIKLAFQCYEKWQTLKDKKNNKAEAHIYELLCCQLWGLFPGFCRQPKDLHNFKLIAKTLGTVLNENPDLRPPILDGFKELLSNLETDEEKEVLAKYAQNYMTRFFNIYTTKPSTTYENEIRTSAFEVAKLYLLVTPKNVLNSLFESAIVQMNSKAPGSFMYDMLFDIVEAMALFQSADKIKELFNNYIVNTLVKDKNEKKAEENGDKLKDLSLRRRLKKAYQLLHDIMTSENEGCLEFVSTELDTIEKILSRTTYKVVEGTQVMRLACFNIVLEKTESVNVKSKIVKLSISEVLASFNNEAVIKDGIAYNLLRTVGQIYENADMMNDFVDAISAGLVGDDNQLISNSVTALKFTVQEFSEKLSVDALNFMIDGVQNLVVANQRNVVDASLHFLVIFVKVLPSPFVANHLRFIMKSLNLMVKDTRRYCRLIVKYLLNKLCKKFTPEEVIKLVPGSDEELHKQLREIKKKINRSKRNRLESLKKKSANGADDDSDDDMLNLDKKSMT